MLLFFLYQSSKFFEDKSRFKEVLGYEKNGKYLIKYVIHLGKYKESFFGDKKIVNSQTVIENKKIRHRVTMKINF